MNKKIQKLERAVAEARNRLMMAELDLQQKERELADEQREADRVARAEGFYDDPRKLLQG